MLSTICSKSQRAFITQNSKTAGLLLGWHCHIPFTSFIISLYSPWLFSLYPSTTTWHYLYSAWSHAQYTQCEVFSFFLLCLAIEMTELQELILAVLINDSITSAPPKIKNHLLYPHSNCIYLTFQQVETSKIYHTKRSYKTRAGRGVWFLFVGVPLHLTPMSNTLLDFSAFRSCGLQQPKVMGTQFLPSFPFREIMKKGQI